MRIDTLISRLRGTAVDAAIALAIGGVLVLESRLEGGVPPAHRLATVMAAILLVAPIVARRRLPGIALIVAATALIAGVGLGGELDRTSGVGVLLAFCVLAYTVGNRLQTRAGLATLGAATVVFSAFVFLATGGVGSLAVGLFTVTSVFLAAWLVGRASRRRSERLMAFRELAAELSEEHAARERAAVAFERARIGRELEDIIAHSVSAMVVQAGGARRLLRSDAERARDSILTIEETGREALADLRRLLGMLRKDDTGLAPQPGLDQLDALLAKQGSTCTLRVEGKPVGLTPGVDLLAYRLVEAVLDSVDAPRRATVRLTLRYETGLLEVEARGDAPLRKSALDGISDRIALYNGAIRFEDGADGAFALRATLPLAAAIPA